ncbi:phage tail protein [Jeotgalibacillus terrae]|uniref:Phage tail protein n=1 Tax=Jeotgalibacillus terrae TaxID=587735 RepID=A0ABW5ZEQ7_9BACL|nr:phage tail protein [Jeotgalibacillus terrae]MBM7580004.1 hypothetical protein [Jeotgalibacillus terrae]
MRTYTTVSGDTFDLIAKKELGNEYLFPLLLKENYRHRETLIFSAGIELKIPELNATKIYDTGPSWLTPEDDESLTEDINVLNGVDA